MCLEGNIMYCMQWREVTLCKFVRFHSSVKIAIMSLQEEVSRVRHRLSLHFRELHLLLDQRELSLLEDIEKDLCMKVQQNELDLIGYSAVLDAVSVCPEMIAGSKNSLKRKISCLKEFNLSIKVVWDDFKVKQEIKNIEEFKIEKIGDLSFDESSFLDTPSINQQKDIIENNLSMPLKKGDKWFLIDMKWFKSWKKFVGYDCSRRAAVEPKIPGPIDNTSLLDKGILSRNLVDEIDFKLLPEKAWSNLVSWYEQSEYSMSLPRPVIESGSFLKQLRIEIYPLELQACLYPNQSDTRTICISRCDTVSALYSQVMTQFSIPEYTPVKLKKKKKKKKGFRYQG